MSLICRRKLRAYEMRGGDAGAGHPAACNHGDALGNIAGEHAGEAEEDELRLGNVK